MSATWKQDTNCERMATELRLVCAVPHLLLLADLLLPAVEAGSVFLQAQQQIERLGQRVDNLQASTAAARQRLAAAEAAKHRAEEGIQVCCAHLKQ